MLRAQAYRVYCDVLPTNKGSMRFKLNIGDTHAR